MKKIIMCFSICILLLIFNINVSNAQTDIEIVPMYYFTDSEFKIQNLQLDGYSKEQQFITGFEIGKLTMEKALSNSNLVEGYTAQAYRNNKKLEKNDKIGTGTIVKVYNEQAKEVQSYIALIYGDVNGDGNISSADALSIIKHKTGKMKIQNSLLLQSARVTEKNRKDGAEPSSADALAIVKAKLGKYTISSENYYKGFEIKGTIKIPKTGIEYPILANTTTNALEVAVAIQYPLDTSLNTKGNITIIGQNYRNDLFFSNNKELEIGDKLYITDEKGRTMEYTIYSKYETTPQDVEYMTRNTEDNIEVSLTTATDDFSKRLIILAKAN